jgi:DNA gyrase subunit A
MEIGIVRQVGIVEEMREAYLDYAMSVITSRALPDVRDGLKPVQRRILYAMDDMGLRHTQPHKKSARIVGEVLGKYHPHSDTAVYDAMVRLAQDFSLRYPLVDGHGNFGSVDGDNAAAMRYTEARLAAIAEEMLVDIDKDTVDFVDNFDGTLKEPKVLPARLPNLLINGGGGIAVGMATNIPPHNLAEICDAISFLIDRYDSIDDVTIEDLMRYVKGPDFPTGGTILGQEGIIAAYATGKGRVVVRAKVHTEDLKGGRTAIIITELPFQVNKASLVERIAEMVRGRRIETISDLRDESDRTGMRVVIELKRGADTQATLNQLLKYTTMQTTFGVNMLALVDGEPRVLSLRRTLQLFIEHRREVIRRRSEFDLTRARQRAHVLEGLKIALDNLDEVIALIRRSRDADTAMTGLMRRFKLTEIQARAILDMQLRRLAALERRKIEEELAEVRRQIAYLEDLLAHPRKMLVLIQQEMAGLRARYGDARRTRIAEEENAELSAEDLIPSEEVFVVVTQRGYIKRAGARAYRARGRSGAVAGDEDAPLHALPANTMDSVLFFTDRGRVCGEKVHQLPDESRQGRGVPLGNLISLDNGEKVAAVVAVPDFKPEEQLLLVTAQGKIKRSQLSEFSTARSSAMAAISLDEGDALRWVGRSRGGQEVILVTAQGKAIRFSEEEVRPTGRTAGGVNAIRLSEGDEVVAADLARPGGEVVVVTARGHAKRAPLETYSSQARGGSGLLTIDGSGVKQSGAIVAMRVLLPEEEILLVSREGLVLRMPARDVTSASRAGRGRMVMRLKASDRIEAIALLNGVDDDSPAPSPPEPEEPPRPSRRKRQARAEADAGRGARGAREPARRGKAAPAKPAAKKPAPRGRTRKPAEESPKATGRKTGGSAGESATKSADKKSAPKARARRRVTGEEAGAGAGRPRQRAALEGDARPAARKRRASKPAAAE